VALISFRGELYAFNRYTAEVFQNTAQDGFVFQRVESAMVMRGALSSGAVCRHGEGLAFVGGNREESVGVFMTVGGGSQRISTREIELRLSELTEAQQADIYIESVCKLAHQWLIVHTPVETYAYDTTGSAAAGRNLWFRLASSASGSGPYRGKFFVQAFGAWMCGDTLDGRIGKLSDTPAQYGEPVAWQFITMPAYNGGKAGIVHELELVATTGRTPFGKQAGAFFSWSDDGVEYSNERVCSMGKTGERAARLVWRRCGAFGNWRTMRFRGVTFSPLSITRIEAQVEPCN
jgi:hypothetical protein